MDKMIVIPLNLFKLGQEILIVNETGTHTFAQVELNELPEVVVEASRAYDINNIKLIGNANYANAVSNEINEYVIRNYSQNTLNLQEFRVVM